MLKQQQLASSSSSSSEGFSILDLPDELIEQIAKHLPTRDMAELASTSRSVHHLLQQELQTNRAAEQLMAHVLNPTEESIQRAKAMVAANPYLMFIETEGYEKASGLQQYTVARTGETRTCLVYRKIKCSPFQAALGTGDSELYNDMAKYFDKVVYKDEGGNIIETGVQRALKQIKEKFPNGFDYPACEDEFNRHINAIVTAITHDQALIDDNTPSEATQAAIAQLRNYLLPQLGAQGHHFNLNHLLKAFETYNQNWNSWHGNQLSLFWRQVIGYLERLVTTVDAQAFCQGLFNFLEENNRQTRSLSLYNYQSASIISYFPPPVSLSGGLGFDFGIGIFGGPAEARARVGAWRAWTEAAVAFVEKYCRAKTSDLSNFLRQLEQRALRTTSERSQAVIVL